MGWLMTDIFSDDNLENTGLQSTVSTQSAPTKMDWLKSTLYYGTSSLYHEAKEAGDYITFQPDKAREEQKKKVIADQNEDFYKGNHPLLDLGEDIGSIGLFTLASMGAGAAVDGTLLTAGKIGSKIGEATDSLFDWGTASRLKAEQSSITASSKVANTINPYAMMTKAFAGMGANEYLAYNDSLELDDKGKLKVDPFSLALGTGLSIGLPILMSGSGFEHGYEHSGESIIPNKIKKSADTKINVASNEDMHEILNKKNIYNDGLNKDQSPIINRSYISDVENNESLNYINNTVDDNTDKISNNIYSYIQSIKGMKNKYNNNGNIVDIRDEQGNLTQDFNNIHEDTINSIDTLKNVLKEVGAKRVSVTKRIQELKDQGKFDTSFSDILAKAKYMPYRSKGNPEVAEIMSEKKYLEDSLDSIRHNNSGKDLSLLEDDIKNKLELNKQKRIAHDRFDEFGKDKEFYYHYPIASTFNENDLNRVNKAKDNNETALSIASLYNLSRYQKVESDLKNLKDKNTRFYMIKNGFDTIDFSKADAETVEKYIKNTLADKSDIFMNPLSSSYVKALARPDKYKSYINCLIRSV